MNFGCHVQGKALLSRSSRGAVKRRSRLEPVTDANDEHFYEVSPLRQGQEGTKPWLIERRARNETKLHGTQRNGMNGHANDYIIY